MLPRIEFLPRDEFRSLRSQGRGAQTSNDRIAPDPVFLSYGAFILQRSSMGLNRVKCKEVGACWGTPSRLGKGPGVRYAMKSPSSASRRGA
jgi:hypothetical protein